MSFASKKLYTGDGVTKAFNVPFPFISPAHVDVYVNETLQLDPMNYSLSSSTVTFQNAPGSGDAIEIKRNTSPTATLVDFVNGSVLNESDLDTSYLHNFYLLQETQDNINQLINEALTSVATGAGIVETETNAVIAALVNEMLNDAAAATLQARITDIDANAESVLEVQTDVSLMGVSNVANTAFILNSATVKIDSDAGNTVAQTISRITANETSVTTNASAISGLEAKYGVTLDVDGYITGFLQNNNGSSGSFVVLADKFAVVTPSVQWAASTAYSVGDMVRPSTSNNRVFRCTTAGTSGASEPTWDTTIGNTTNDGSVVWTTHDDVSRQPFLIDGDKIIMNGDVSINGSLLLNGTVVGSALVAGTIGSTQIGANAVTTTQLNASAVTAAKIAANAVDATKINVADLAAVSADLGSITAGNITLDTAGYIKGGQTAYNTGTGFFLGYDTAAYKFSIGDGGVSDFMTWDGSKLVVRGDISIGSYISDTTNILLQANTERNTNALSFQEVKKFEINRPGTVRVYLSYKCGSTTGGLVSNSQFRIKLDGVVQQTYTLFSTTYTTSNYEVTTTATSQYITIEYMSGERDPVEPLPCGAYVKDCQIKAIKSDGESVITD